MVSRLKELQLSTHEAQTYIALLAHPNITASMLCKETDIPDSKIYYALDGLSRKGMLNVQQGNPNIYQPVPPKEAIANLKQQLTDKFNEQMKQTDALIDLLTPLLDSAEKPEEFELAYIIRGQKNIANKMKTLIQASKQEITVFIPFLEVLQEIKKELIEAKEKRKVKLNIAVTEEVLKSGKDLSDYGEVKLLCCVLGMLISDMKILLTLTNWTNELAVMTQDQNLMRVCRDYYDNPSCCMKIQKKSKKMLTTKSWRSTNTANCGPAKSKLT